VTIKLAKLLFYFEYFLSGEGFCQVCQSLFATLSALTCSMSKSHSGDGERAVRLPGGGVPSAGEPAWGSSGITANRPRWRMGEMAP